MQKLFLHAICSVGRSKGEEDDIAVCVSDLSLAALKGLANRGTSLGAPHQTRVSTIRNISDISTQPPPHKKKYWRSQETSQKLWCTKERLHSVTVNECTNARATVCYFSHLICAEKNSFEFFVESGENVTYSDETNSYSFSGCFHCVLWYIFHHTNFIEILGTKDCPFSSKIKKLSCECASQSASTVESMDMYHAWGLQRGRSQGGPKGLSGP